MPADKPSDDPVMVITGASSGIGAETARRAAKDGYNVVLAARNEDKLEALAAELDAGKALAVPTDVTDWPQVEALAEAAVSEFGRLDVVFANAGFGASRGFLEETPEQWKGMVLTNIYGVALTIRATLPILLERDAGHFVISGSVAGRRNLPGSLYSATKWAVGAISESLRQELRQEHENHTIRVTLIEPGMTDTPFFDDRPTNALEPGDIAGAVLWALTQPAGVDVNEVLIRPVSQAN